MTFEEILDQAIAMLQRRGRLTYGTLKRQFQLDDSALEDLKNELIEGQRLAVDERGNILVWTGAEVSPPHPPPPSASSAGATAEPAGCPARSGVRLGRRPERLSGSEGGAPRRTPGLAAHHIAWARNVG